MTLVTLKEFTQLRSEFQTFRSLSLVNVFELTSLLFKITDNKLKSPRHV